MSDVSFAGIAAMAVLYLAVFGVGVWAGRRAPPPRSDDDALHELLLAGRSLPLWVGLLTMTATWVGGGYINGTAERTYSSGVMWGAQAGVGYAISLVLGGLFFARVMRRHDFATLIDPLEARYGRVTAAVLMIPAVLAELFWSAAILVALGTTFGTVIGVDLTASIVISAAIAVAYTVFGGLRAVAYTDVVQLFLILGGLTLAVPFVVAAAGGPAAVWASAGGLGPGSAGEAVSYGDWLVLLILGGIPWNVYFQRVLAAKDPDTAARTSILAGGLCALMAVPPLLLGLAGARLDWSAIDTGGVDVAAGLATTPSLVLPSLLRWAVPSWVGVIGLGAISAAVMSSVDSSILSAAALIAWNGYRRLFRPHAGAEEITRLVQVLIVVLGGLATGLALTVQSVAALWYLCGDVVYCVLFPQLTLALFDPKANRSGALAGLAVSATIRLTGGEATLGLPVLVPYPALDGFEFPFRTLAMVAGLCTAVGVSRLTGAVDPPLPLRNPQVRPDGPAGPTG